MKKCKGYIIIPYVTICCVLHRKKSIIGLIISHPITVAVNMASVTPQKNLTSYDGTGRQEQGRQCRQGNIHAILDSLIIFFWILSRTMRAILVICVCENGYIGEVS